MAEFKGPPGAELSVPLRPLPRPPSGAESKGRPRHNFLEASNRDAIVHGAERPGQPKPNPDCPSTPRGPLVATAVVDQWCAHLKSKGIKRVLSLLSEAELDFYSEPLMAQLSRQFGVATRVQLQNETALAEVSLTDFKTIFRVFFWC